VAVTSVGPYANLHLTPDRNFKFHLRLASPYCVFRCWTPNTSRLFFCQSCYNIH